MIGQLNKFLLSKKFFSLLGDLKDKSILDIGCGSGWLSKILIQKGTKDVIGVDIFKGMIKKA